MPDLSSMKPNENTRNNLRISNYEIMKNQVQQRFANYDHGEIIRKFNLEFDSEYIYLIFLKRKYRIHCITGEVTWLNEQISSWHAAGFNEVLTIFDVLCDSKPDCHLSGEYINMHRLSSLQNGNTGILGGSFHRKSEDFFDQNRAKLTFACEKLGGVPHAKGDVAYILPLFDFLPVLFQFWFSDEEFPASIEIFFDKNTLQYMRFETLWYAAGYVIERIKEEMNIGGSK